MIFDRRLAALVAKEFHQLRRDPRAAMAVVVAPMLQLLLFSTLLVATVTSLPIGIVDESQTPESRELIATLTGSKSFTLAGYFATTDGLAQALNLGRLDAGVVIPYDLSKNLWRGRATQLQFLLNASNANTATIAQSYAEGVLQSYNAQLAGAGFHAQFTQIAAPALARAGQVLLMPAFLFNPGLVGSWFTVTGVLGLLLVLNGSVLAAMTLIKEREAGTMEQLLMSPATPTQIIIAKISPLFLLLSAMATFSMLMVRLVFGVPFHGSIVLLIAGEILCLLCGIGLGTFVATITTTARQVQLTLFFLNPPLSALSGAFAPVEAMPAWMQPFAVLDPIRHFGVISRGILLKGSGLSVLWPNFLALLAFTVALLSLSIWRYRRQLS
ncbi:MAG: ABC transporter permease [Candidatus Cybelea sp.]